MFRLQNTRSADRLFDKANENLARSEKQLAAAQHDLENKGFALDMAVRAQTAQDEAEAAWRDWQERARTARELTTITRVEVCRTKVGSWWWGLWHRK